MPLASVVAVRLMAAPSKLVPVSVSVMPAMPVSPAVTRPSLLKSRNTRPASDDALTDTLPLLLLLPALMSSDEVATEAVLLKFCGVLLTATICTGTVMSTSPPLLTVPRVQVKATLPALPLHVVDVVVPAILDCSPGCGRRP